MTLRVGTVKLGFTRHGQQSMTNRTKLSDVATLAGVSSATVSRVLNGNGQVNPALVDRVNTALAATKYRRNGLARGLRRQRNNLIGALVPDVGNPFFTEAVRGIEDELRPEGLLVVLCNTDDDPIKESEYLQLLIDQQAAGIIIAAAGGESASLAAAHEHGTPVVAIDRSISDAFDTIVMDNVRAAHDLTLRLLDRYQLVAHIGGPLRTSTGLERAEGYRQALVERGIVYNAALCRETNYSERGGYEAMSQLLGYPTPPEAVFVGNNVMSLGALRALTEARARVAIASFDPLPWSAISQGELIVLDHPSYELGVASARMLLERLNGSHAAPKTLVLPGGPPINQG